MKNTMLWKAIRMTKTNKSKCLLLVFLALGIRTSSPSNAQVSGKFGGANGGAVVIGTSTTTCDSTIEGAIRYNSTDDMHEACDGTSWTAFIMDGAAGGASCPTAGLVSYWPMNENSGTTINDNQGSNDGTFNGSPSWTTGKFGYAVQFDGTNDYISVASHSSLEGFTAFTLSAWIYPTSNAPSGWGRIISKQDGTTSDDYALVYAAGNEGNVRVQTSTVRKRP